MELVYTDHYGRKWISIKEAVKRYFDSHPTAVWKGVYYEYNDVTGIWTKLMNLEEVRIKVARYAEKMTELPWSNQYKEEANEQIRVQVKQLDAMDESETLVCLQNCVIDLTTGEAFEFSQDYHFLTRFEIEYKPESKCPRTLEFLEQISCGNFRRQQTLEEFMGLAFTRKRCEKAMVLVGNGLNGKSVYCNMLTTLLGQANYTSMELAALQTFGSGKLLGKRLAVMSEISKSDSQHLMTSQMKQVITGDVMSGNAKYKDLFDFRPFAKVLILSNYMISLHEDASIGATRRFHIVPFELQLNESDRDDQLLEKLLEEKSGIFNLAMRGFQRFMKQGGIFSSSIESREIIKRILKRDEPLAEFVREVVVFSPESRVSYDKLKADYVKWCSTNDLETTIPDSRAFMSEISKFGRVSPYKSNGRRGIRGIRLK